MTELFRNTLSAWQWILLALIPPAIISLYFLKLRRQPLEVPSTYLWRRSIEDMHVNSLWQRLRKNLLMFLQLLLVGLAILALLRPGWEGTRLEGQRFVFLIDNSASMSATDVDDATNRLEEAKKLAENLIDQMDSDMSAMIISFADTPRVVQDFTSNRRLLRERLRAIRPSSQGTDLRGALELASHLAQPNRQTTAETHGDPDAVASPAATVYIFSDGRFEDVRDFALNDLQAVYVPIGSLDAANLAITAVATRQSEERPEQQQAFVQVANFTTTPQKVIVELTLDGQFLDAQKVEVPPGETAGTVFALAEGAAGGLAARLKYELDGAVKDTLVQDDVGYAALNNIGTGKVLVVTPGNATLEAALRTERAARLAIVQFASPAELETAQYRRDAESGMYDLVIYDQCAPPELPQANTLFIGQLPPGAAWQPREDESGESNDNNEKLVAEPQIIDWNRDHPLLAHLELGEVQIADSLLVRPPAGGDVLIESTTGPIAAIGPRDSHQDAVLGFEIVGRAPDGSQTVNTNWPIRPAFPTFWLNVLEYLASHNEEQNGTAARPGRPVELRAPANVAALSVIPPDGQTASAVRTDRGTFQFTDTETPGIYEVRQGDQATERFAVSLFDRTESDVRVRPSQDAAGSTIEPAAIRIGHVDVAAAADRAPSRRELWKILLTCGLFLLVLEWYIYNRRVYF